MNINQFIHRKNIFEGTHDFSNRYMNVSRVLRMDVSSIRAPLRRLRNGIMTHITRIQIPIAGVENLAVCDLG